MVPLQNLLWLPMLCGARLQGHFKNGSRILVQVANITSHLHKRTPLLSALQKVSKLSFQLLKPS